MVTTAAFAEIAALAGDPTRAGMLHALMDGRALTCSELARVAGITPQTASGHLAHMTVAGLLAVERQGRHRYHRLASPAVARMMEGIMRVAADSQPQRRTLSVGPRDAALRAGRTCYDHLAGRLGVALADALVAGGYAELTHDAGLITESGTELLRRIGIDVEALCARRGRAPRILCRPCLDWSERRPHISGALGAAIADTFFKRGWAERLRRSRTVRLTDSGRRALSSHFGASV